VDRDADDYAVHEAVAETEAMLEYDTIGRFKYHDDESERRLILHMLEKGYEKQLLLSLDTTAERLTSYGGAIGLTYLIRVFLPLLRQQGVPEDVVRTLTVDNPMGVFL
jgi:phosphotriesterase-related protein